MRLLLTLLSTCVLSASIAACGSTSKDASSSQTSNTPKTVSVSTTPTKAPPAPVETKTDADKDNDASGFADEKNNDSVLDFGHAADSSDQREITSLIKRYYAAAVTENGAKACSLLYSTIEESVPEDYGISPPSQPYLRGTTCPAVLTLLFKHYHPQLLLEYPKLEVARVRMIEHHGLVILRFGKLPEREIPVGREGHTWKLDALLDNEMP